MQMLENSYLDRPDMMYTALGTNVSQPQLSQRGTSEKQACIDENGKRIADFHTTLHYRYRIGKAQKGWNTVEDLEIILLFRDSIDFQSNVQACHREPT